MSSWSGDDSPSRLSFPPPVSSEQQQYYSPSSAQVSSMSTRPPSSPVEMKRRRQHHRQQHIQEPAANNYSVSKREPQPLRKTRKELRQTQCYIGCGITFFILVVLLSGFGCLALALCVFASSTISVGINVTDTGGSSVPFSTSSVISGSMTCTGGGGSSAVSMTAAGFNNVEVIDMNTTPEQVFNLNQWQLGLLGTGFVIAGFLALIGETFFNRKARGMYRQRLQLEARRVNAYYGTGGRNEDDTAAATTTVVPGEVCPVPCICCVKTSITCYRFTKIILSRLLWFLFVVNLIWFGFTIMLFLLFRTTTTTALNQVTSTITSTNMSYTLASIPVGCTAPVTFLINDILSAGNLNGDLAISATASITPPIWGLAIICAGFLGIILLVKCVPWKKCCKRKQQKKQRRKK